MPFGLAAPCWRPEPRSLQDRLGLRNVGLPLRCRPRHRASSSNHAIGARLHDLGELDFALLVSRQSIYL